MATAITRRRAVIAMAVLPFHREPLPECESLGCSSWPEVAVEIAGWEYRAISQEFRGWRSVHCTCCVNWSKGVVAFVGFGEPARSSAYRESIIEMLADTRVRILGDAINPNRWSFAVLAHASKDRFSGLKRRWLFGRQPHNAY